MTRGFYTVLAAQFFSALADNALIFAAIALLKTSHAPAWQVPALQEFFVVAFIVLAPFVGPFADALPKGQVMFLSNGVKFIGCVAMLAGMQPLFAYAVVGIGAAMYSPAKYGILTEFLPKERLVWANGWMEGLTVAAVIMGAVIGGLLIGPRTEQELMRGIAQLDYDFGIKNAAQFAIAIMLLFYGIAAVFNLYIPKLPIERELKKHSLSFLLRDFWQSFVMLWRDPLGQVSLAVTSLFWGAGTTLRFVVIAWAAVTLNFDLEQATQLTAVVAVGIAIGAVIAAKMVPLGKAVHVMPVGIAMGAVVMAMAWVTDWRVAVPILILIGTFGGCFVVPMNALLQYRGHQLMGAGHSIALQNLSENTSILLMLGAYSAMVNAEFSAKSIVLIVGVFVVVTMALLTKIHWRDQG